MPIWLWAVILGVALLALTALGGWWVLRHQSAETKAILRRIGRLPWRAKARLAWELVRDRRLPLWVRAIIPALVLYLALPLDIIPDFIPVLGHLDDLLLAALAVGALLRFTPRHVLEEHLSRLEIAVHPGP